ncbi:hypothetical protein PN499_14295 [Kamptonema animale CS-326]|nr:hypothetical protein [Kamptonema animale]MDB9512358.1 hypothetical protein [Kamptonema animale CS-326]
MRLSKEGVCFACKCSDRIGWLDGANLPGDRPPYIYIYVPLLTVT